MNSYNIPVVKMVYVSENYEFPQLRSSQDSFSAFFRSFDDGEIGMQEFFKVAYLNHANKLIGIQTISMGGTASTVVDLKILFSGALTAKAASIMLCHNHPSGNLKPSTQDDELTRKIINAATLLDMKVLDHIVIVPDGCRYYSYADEGKI